MAPKAVVKTPQPKVKAAPRAAAAPSKADIAKAEDQEKLQRILREILICYDENEDGRVERVEFLDGEEKRLGKCEFGPKQRKEAFAFFKEAGASGSPSDGMWLEQDQLFAALLKLASAELGVDAADAAQAGKIADWLWEHRAKALIEATYHDQAEAHGTGSVDVAELKLKFKDLDKNGDGYLQESELAVMLKKGSKPMTDEEIHVLFKSMGKDTSRGIDFNEFVDYIFAKPKAASGSGAAGAAPRTAYPVTVPFTELKMRIDEARDAGRHALVLSSGLEQVETFLQYSGYGLIDCKQILGEVFVGKSKSKGEAQAETQKALQHGLCATGGFCKPVHVRLGNSAFNWKEFCFDGFPEDVFSATLWTPQNALDRNLIDEQQFKNVCMLDNKKWHDFMLVISSTFDLEKSNEYLFDKIPHYDELAIIVIDPKSVAS